MTLNLDNEGILKQLGYTSINDALLNQISSVREETREFEKIEKHIFDLHQSLQKINGGVLLSNSRNLLKIKHHQSANAVQNKEFHEIVENWAKRYKIEVKKISDETYYIIGLHK